MRKGRDSYSSLSNSSLKSRTNDKKKSSTTFEAILGQRKVNLSEQRQRLRTAKERMEKEYEELARTNAKLTAQENDMEDLEGRMHQSDHTDSYINTGSKTSELKQRNTMIAKTEADLKHQLRLAKIELEETEYAMKTIEHTDAATVQNMQRQLEEKLVLVQTLKDLINSLNTEILSRENEVMEMELNAMEYHKRVVEMTSEKLDLEKRKQKAIEEKQSLMRLIENAEKENQEKMEQQSAVQKSLDEALERKEHLAKLELELDQMAIDVEKKRQQVNTASAKLGEIRMHKVQAENELRMKQNASLREELLGGKKESETEEEDLQELEYQLDKEERELHRKEVQLEIERSVLNMSSSSRKERIAGMIETMKKILSKMKTVDEIESELDQATAENQKAHDDLEQKKAELESLKTQLVAVEQIKSQQDAVAQALKDVSARERDLNRQMIELQLEENQVAAEEAEMKVMKLMIDSEKAEIEKRNELTKKMLEVHTAQLKTVQERYEQMLHASNSNA